MNRVTPDYYITIGIKKVISNSTDSIDEYKTCSIDWSNKWTKSAPPKFTNSDIETYFNQAIKMVNRK